MMTYLFEYGLAGMFGEDFSTKLETFTIGCDDFQTLARHYVWCLDALKEFGALLDIIQETKRAEPEPFAFTFVFCIEKENYKDWRERFPGEAREFDAFMAYAADIEPGYEHHSGSRKGLIR